ncbi:MAG: DUF7507 domain-containing protein [Clostridium sp.]
MPLINRFSTIDRGALIFTGNTLGLAGYLASITPFPTGTVPPLLPGPGAVDSIGTFITTQNLTAAGGWPLGTTDNYLQNSSSAQVIIPPGSTILYAELIWSGIIVNQDFNLLANLNSSVNFMTPVATTPITPDPTTTISFSAGGSGNTAYVASQDVTALVQAGGSGTYTTGAVPGVLGNSVNSIPPFTPPLNVSPQNFLGWTLAIAYKNASLPVRSLYIWVNDDLINAAAPPLDIAVTGLATATTGALQGKLFISSGEGDANIVGDQAFFGPNVGSLVNIGNVVTTPNANPGTTPNNPGNNFFSSQINGGNGLLDTTGTFGTVNQQAFPGTNISAARQGWDIATVDVSNALLNNQTSAVIRLSTVGDAYINNAVGLQVNALEPIFEMNKAVDKTIVNVGDTLTYTVTMKNISIINADNVIFTDAIPPETSFVAGSVIVDGSPQGGANPVTGINLGTIAPNQTVTVVFTVKVNSLPPTPPQLNNVAVINYTFEAVVGTILSGTTTTTPVTTEVVQPNLISNKTVDKAFANLGDVITYTVTLQNAGALPLTNIQFQDAIPAGTTYVNGSLTVDAGFTGTDPQTGLTITTINPGQTVTISWQVQIGNTFPTPNPIPNTGTVTVLGVVQNTNQVTTQVNNGDLTISKAVNKTQTIVGDTVTYTITVTNTGNVNANPAILTDIAPNGTTFIPGSLIIDNAPAAGDPNAGINIGPIAPGQTKTIIFTVTVNSLPTPNPMPNTANINYQYLVNPAEAPIQVSKDSNTVTTAVGIAQVSKSVNKANADFGDIITYSIILNNTGIAPVNNIVVTDPVPAGTTYVNGSLNVVSVNPAGITFTGTDPQTGLTFATVVPGQVVTISWQVQVGNTFPVPNPILNSGTVTADGLNPVNTNTVSTQVNHADLNLVKAVDKTQAVVGETVTYTIDVTNTGNVSVNPATITDIVPNGTTYAGGTLTVDGIPNGGNPNAGVNIGPIAAGQTKQIVFSVVINTLPNPNPMPNTATASFQYLVDPTSQNPTTGSATSNTVNTSVGDLAINKSVNKAFANLGENLIYTVTLTNTGIIPINNVLFQDQIPAGTTYVNGSLSVDAGFTGTTPQGGITITTINPGQIVTISWEVQVGNIVPTPNPIPNVGTVTIPGLPPTNTNQVTTQVNNATLIVDKAVDKATAAVGETVVYTINVTNTGNVAANPATITDIVPNGASYVSGTLTVDGLPNGGDPNTGFNIGSIAAGQTKVIIFSAKINVLPTPNPMQNVATVDYQYLVDPNGIPVPGTAISNVAETVVGDLIVNKAVDKVFANIGDTITYTVTLQNTGLAPLNNVAFQDSVPSGTTYVNGSLNVDSTFTGTDPQTGLTIATINPGQIVTITWEVLIDNALPTPNPIVNIGTTTIPGLPPVNTNQVTTQVNNANLVVVKNVDKATASVGDTVTYTINVTNNGNVAADPAILTDLVPNGTTYIPGTLTVDGFANAGNPNAGFNIGPVAAGVTKVVVFSVKINVLPVPNPMVNTADVAYEYLVDPNGLPVSDTATSNRVETAVGDLVLNKAVDKNFANLGDTITYTVTIQNTGIGAIANVFFQDSVPSGTTYVNGSLTVDTAFTGTDPQSGLTITTINPGQTATITWKVQVDNALPTINPIPNVGTVTIPGLPPISTNQVATQINNATLDVVKVVDKTQSFVGDTVSYTITVTNSGNVAANPAILTDLVPNGTSYIPGTLTVDGIPNIGDPNSGFNVGPIAVGLTKTIVFSVKIDTLPVPNPMLNTADIAYQYLVDPNGTPVSDTATSNTVNTAVGNLVINKAVDKSFADLGDTITYIVTLQNTGIASINNVAFNDVVPNGTTYVSGSLTVDAAFTGTDPQSGLTITTVAAGQTVTITWKVQVGNTIPIPNPIPNVGIVTIPGILPVNTNQVTTQINNSTLNVIKVVDKVEAVVGETITYTITVTNNGNVVANPAILTDLVPNGTSYVGGTLTVNGVPNPGDPNSGFNVGPIAAGETKTIVFSVKINTLPVPNPMPNTTNVDYQYLVNPNGTPVSDTATSNTVNTAVGDLVINKAVDKIFADTGDIITYTVKLQNVGIAPINNTLFQDAIPVGTTFVNGSLSVDAVFTGTDPQSGLTITTIVGAQTVTITWKVQVGNTIPTPNPIPNVGTVTIPGLPPVDTNQVTTQVNNATLNVVKSVDKSQAAVGDVVTYTVVITNSGNVSANPAIFTDLVPNGTSYILGTLTVDGIPNAGDPNSGVNVGPISAGATKTIIFSVKINTLPIPNPMPNTADVAYQYLVDPNGALISDTATSNTVTTAVGDLLVNKAVDKSFADLGDIITYTVTLENTGKAPLNNVAFQDAVPAGTTYVNGSLNVDAAFTGLSPQSGLTITAINPGQIVTISWQVKVDNTIPASNPIVNVGTATIPGLPSVDTNQVTTQVNNATLSAVKVVDKAQASVGETVVYTITVTNSGNVSANPAVFTDLVPNGASYVPGTLTVGGVPNPGDPNSGVNVGPIAAGGVKTIVFSAKINTLPIPNPMLNNAKIDYQYLVDPNGAPTSDSVTSNTVETAVGDLVLNKSVDKVFADLGDIITYTVTLENTGEAAISNALFQDSVPSGTTYVNGSLIVDAAFTGTDPQTGVTITTVNPGQVVTISWKVQVGNTVPTPNPVLNIGVVTVPGLPPVNTNQVTTQINNATLEPVKSVDRVVSIVGEIVTYTIDVTNTGSVAANPVILKDVVPNGTSYVAGTLIVDGIQNPGDLNVGVNIGQIAAGATRKVVFSVKINTLPIPNPMPNTASVDYQYLVDPNGTPVSDTAISNTVETAVGNIVVNKAVDKVFTDLGDTITYTVTLENTGKAAVGNVLFQDSIPAGTTFINGSLISDAPITGNNPQTGVTVTSVAAGQKVSISWKVLIGNTVPTPNPIPNSGTITIPGLPPISTNTVTTTVNNATLNLVKSVDKDLAIVGEIVTYTIVVTNSGSTAANPAIITDIVPNGTSYVAGTLKVNGIANAGDPNTGFNVGPIAAGATKTIVFSVKIDALPMPNPMPNTASADYQYLVDPNGLPVSDKATSNIVDTAVGDIVVNKAVDKAFADLGDLITYTVTIDNPGKAAVNDVVFQDIIPVGTSFVAGSLSVDAPYTGSNIATGITITTVNPGQKVTITWKVKVGNTLPDPNPMPNTGVITIPGLPAKNTNTVTTQVNNADLVSPGNFVKSVDKSFADIGDIVTYTVTAKNTGNVAANNVIITDIIPNGTSYVEGTLTVDGAANPSDLNAGVNVGTVNSGQTVTLVFSVKVDVMPNPNPIPNKADIIYNYTVDPAQPPKTASGTTNTVTTQINNADLVSPGNFVKSVDKAFADIGDTVTYTVVAKNTGNVAANNVVIKDIVPNGAIYVAGSLKVDGIANPSDPNVGISIGTIAPGNNVVIVFSVVVNAIPVPNPMPNKADVTYNYIIDPANPPKSASGSTNTVTTKVNNGEIRPEDAVKSANRVVTTPGDVITYTVSFKNTGNTNLQDVIVRDVVPVGTIFVPGTVKIDGVLDPLADPIVGIKIATVGSNETVAVSFNTKVQEGAPAVLTNTATIDYSYIVDPNLPPKVKTVQTNPVNVDNLNPNLSIVKSSNVSGALVGDTIRYTLNIINDGEIDLTNVVIKDPLAAELQFVDNMTLNGGAIGGNIVSGVNIGTLIVGKTAVLAFDAKVISLPIDGKINNISNAKYDYIVSGQTFSKSAISNENIVSVYNPKLDVTKVSNKKSVKVGDIFTYTIVAKNSGNIEIKNAIVKDILPSEFNVQSIKVDGVSVVGNLNTGINIGNLQIGESKIVTISIKVMADLVDTFKNVAVIEGIIIVDPDQGPRPIKGEGKDPIGVTVFNPELTLVKNVDKEYAVVGEEVTYSIIAANTGDIALDNVIISDSLAGQLEFVMSSITVDGVAMPLENITSGVNIGTIESGKNKIIIFKAKVLSDELKEIPNISNGDYEFTLPGVPPQSGGTSSNEVIIKIEKANILVNKTADRDTVSLGDEITYTVELTNNGTVDALHVIFKDMIPTGTVLINGSFNVDGRVINSVDLVKGIDIGTIKVGQKVIVQYKVKVVEANCKGILTNKASVKFRYVLPDGTIGTIESTPDSASSTDVKLNISNFKQISVDEYLRIPSQKPDMEAINNIEATVEFASSYVIKTPKNYSNEAQNLTGYKLIINGILDQVVEYTALVPEQTVHSAHYRVPFSTFIILPEEFKECDRIDIEGIVEDIYYKEKNCREFFKNVTVLVVAKIIKCNSNN